MPYDSFNLAQHVSDDPSVVEQNRDLLQSILESDSTSSPQPLANPVWVSQAHGTNVLNLDQMAKFFPPEQEISNANFEADAVYSSRTAQPCLVQTADCLPVLFCDSEGREVAAAHAGWRGLAAGVLDATVASFEAFPNQLLAWMGPAIGAQHFEVGEDVYQSFSSWGDSYSKAFQPISGTQQQKWLADLYQLARYKLESLGLNQIFGGDYCTYRQSDLFYSYRRDGATGRMASVIWRTT